jgi:hypothetical protein
VEVVARGEVRKIRGWATAQVTSDRAERATRFTADGEGGRLAHVVDGAHQDV